MSGGTSSLAFGIDSVVYLLVQPLRTKRCRLQSAPQYTHLQLPLLPPVKTKLAAFQDLRFRSCLPESGSKDAMSRQLESPMSVDAGPNSPPKFYTAFGSRCVVTAHLMCRTNQCISLVLFSTPSSTDRKKEVSQLICQQRCLPWSCRPSSHCLLLPPPPFKRTVERPKATSCCRAGAPTASFSWIPTI